MMFNVKNKITFLIISLFIISCSSLKKETKYKDLKPEINFNYEKDIIPRAEDTKTSTSQNVCIKENIEIYESFLKDNTKRRKYRLGFLIEATKLVDLNFENYISYEMKKYDYATFRYKDQMIHSSIMESFQYIKNEHSYNIQFDKYATTLEKSCNISYCNSDRDQVKKLNKLLDQAIAAQQKLLLLKYELMNGLYGYKINQTITLDQLEQLRTSINSAIEKTNLQARAEELNNRALTLFNNKIKNLCQN